MYLNYNEIYKILIVGDSGVGKSNLMLRYVSDQFIMEMNPTIGVEFGIKYVNINDIVIKAQIWDTAGQERFRAIIKSYYRSTNCIILVYDITKRETFDNLDKWLIEIKSVNEDNIPIMLIGNMCDLSHLRQIPTNIGKKFADDNNMLFLETSVLHNINVNLAFETIITAVYNRMLPKKNNVETISSFKKEEAKNTCCRF